MVASTNLQYSIVIPTYNNKVILKNTLESLNDQLGFEDGGYEVIVADDGSNDDTYNFVKDIPRTFTLQYKYLERAAESSRALVRNAGWHLAQGEYVVFLDSDMIVARNYLSELDRYFRINPDLLVMSNRYFMKEPVSYEEVRSGEIFERNFLSLDCMEDRHFYYQITSFNISAQKHPWYFVYTCNLALSKRNLVQLGGFYEGFRGWGMEDTDFGLRCHKLGMRIVCHLGIEAIHQFHGETYGDVKSLTKITEWYKNINLFYKIHKSLRLEIPLVFVYFACLFNTIPQLVLRREWNRSKHHIVFKDVNDLSALKDELLAMSSQKGRLIIVHDEVESTPTDLSLWIQMLGYTASEIRYYPRSYVFSREEIKQFQKGVFTWKRIWTLVFRSLKVIGAKLFQKHKIAK